MFCLIWYGLVTSDFASRILKTLLTLLSCLFYGLLCKQTKRLQGPGDERLAIFGSLHDVSFTGEILKSRDMEQKGLQDAGTKHLPFLDHCMASVLLGKFRTGFKRLDTNTLQFLDNCMTDFN